MKLYKLTNQDMTTHNGTLWELNKPKTLPPVADPQLCTDQVLHAYTCSILALLLNPIHANIANPRLFAAAGEPVVAEWDKCGTFSLVLTKELPLPEWWTDRGRRKRTQVKFAVLCAETVLEMFEKQYSTDDRPRKAIEAAKNYLLNPSSSSSYVAYAAARAADAAYAAARAADAADAAYAAADAAAYAAYAARAARAARAADAAPINISALAQEATT